MSKLGSLVRGRSSIEAERALPAHSGFQGPSGRLHSQLVHQNSFWQARVVMPLAGTESLSSHISWENGKHRRHFKLGNLKKGIGHKSIGRSRGEGMKRMSPKDQKARVPGAYTPQCPSPKSCSPIPLLSCCEGRAVTHKSHRSVMEAQGDY